MRVTYTGNSGLKINYMTANLAQIMIPASWEVNLFMVQFSLGEAKGR